MVFFTAVLISRNAHIRLSYSVAIGSRSKEVRGARVSKV